MRITVLTGQSNRDTKVIPYVAVCMEEEVIIEQPSTEIKRNRVGKMGVKEEIK